MNRSTKIRLAMVLVLGSYICWQQYQLHSVTVVSTESLLESTRDSTTRAELWSADAASNSNIAGGNTGSGSRAISPLQNSGQESVNEHDRNNLPSEPASLRGLGNSAMSAIQSDQNTPAPVLSPIVFDAINNIQELIMAEQWDAALEQLNAMYEERDQLNGFERSTMLMFYTNVLLHHRMLEEAAIVYREVIEIPETNESARNRALQALQQLSAE